MTKFQTSGRTSEQGFTLVELAIVMVIIGLLIGGILKGQELIANARISSTVSQVKGLDAAMNTFQDKFNGLPGDIRNVGDRLPNCTSTTCDNDGDGNGRYDEIPGVAPVIGAEGVAAFAQMAAADLLSNVSTTSTEPTEVMPAVSVGTGGFMWLGTTDSDGAGTGGLTTLQPSRTYVALNSAAVVAAGSGPFSATVAAQLDRKLDDGQPQTGTTQAVCSADLISANTYIESDTAGTCSLYTRVLN